LNPSKIYFLNAPIFPFLKHCSFNEEVYIKVVLSDRTGIDSISQEVVRNFILQEFIPAEENWIHTIPVLPGDLNQAETLLTHQIAQSLFWTIYMDYKREKGR
jgi:hypothetical protein